jgi:hypothetical protein
MKIARQRQSLRGFIGGFLLGTCVVFILVVLTAGWNAWRNPIRAGDKGFDRDVTWLERTSWSFGPGIVVGGLVGTLTGMAVVVIRLHKASRRSEGLGRMVSSGDSIHNSRSQ